MRRVALLKYPAATLLALTLMLGCGTTTEKSSDTGGSGTIAPPHTPTTVTVSIVQMKFQPETLRVHQGDTVVFTNKDLVDHDVTSLPDSAWTSHPLHTGDSWRWVADKRTDYFCSLHVVMRGRVEVE